jgi:hypothetical protein
MPDAQGRRSAPSGTAEASGPGGSSLSRTVPERTASVLVLTARRWTIPMAQFPDSAARLVAVQVVSSWSTHGGTGDRPCVWTWWLGRTHDRRQSFEARCDRGTGCGQCCSTEPAGNRAEGEAHDRRLRYARSHRQAAPAGLRARRRSSCARFHVKWFREGRRAADRTEAARAPLDDRGPRVVATWGGRRRSCGQLDLLPDC